MNQDTKAAMQNAIVVAFNETSKTELIDYYLDELKINPDMDIEIAISELSDYSLRNLFIKIFK